MTIISIYSVFTWHLTTAKIAFIRHPARSLPIRTRDDESLCISNNNRLILNILEDALEENVLSYLTSNKRNPYY